MKVLVIGSTGGSGRAAVSALLAAGHEVTAFARHAGSAFAPAERLRMLQGDVMNPRDVENAVAGQDAVVVTLGISENPLRVRFFGPAHTPADVRSSGTRNVIGALRKHGVRRLVVQSSYGTGDTRALLGFVERLFFVLLLAPQIADTELQNQVVTQSGLDWVLVQPVHLTDGPDEGMPFCSTDGKTARMKLSRRSVGRFLAAAVEGTGYVGRSVALSGASERVARALIAPSASR